MLCLQSSGTVGSVPKLSRAVGWALQLGRQLTVLSFWARSLSGFPVLSGQLLELDTVLPSQAGLLFRPPFSGGAVGYPL